MEPVIKTGSMVVTKAVDTTTLKVGDIVAFTSPSNPKEAILHRIYSVKSTAPIIFQTKGDNNNSPDPWDLPQVGVLGKYYFAIPYLGYLGAFIKTKFGFALLIVIPSIIFIISQIIFIKKQLKLLSLIFIFLLPIFFAKNIHAKFIGSSTINGATITVGNLTVPEIPSAILPDENNYVNPDSIYVAWTDTDAKYYIYQSSNDSNFYDPYTSENLINTNFTTTGTSDYIYYWHVKACNGINYCSNWSTTSSFIVDGTPPTSFIDDIPYATNQNNLNLVYSAFDNVKVDNTKLCYSFNLQNYQCQDNFDFNFNDGNGIYYFYSKATDTVGNTEDKNSFTNSIIYDTIPPTTNLLISTTAPTYSGQNLSTSIGQSFYLDSYIEKILIPHNLSANLTFSFKYFSQDLAQYSHLDVGVSTTDNIWNLLTFGGEGDFDWQKISHSLLQWAGQTVDIYFKLTALDPTFITTTIIKDLNISTLDLRTSDSTPPEFLSTDLGAGIFESSTTPDHISSTDLALNIESTHSISIVTLPQIVLNKITSSTITIYNNTDTSVNLNNWFLDIGSTVITINGTIPSFSTLDFNNDIGTTKIILKNNLNEIVDSTTFDILGNSVWQRQQNGLGPWALFNDQININLENSLSQSKITLIISGLGDTSIDLNYSINYFANNIEQQIAGTILPNTVDSTGTISRDFYLGTCSTGVCIPTLNIGSTFTVTFSTLPTKTFVF